MMKEYMIVTEPSAREMERVVNIHLRRGWELHGDLVMEINRCEFVQAMTRDIWTEGTD